MKKYGISYESCLEKIKAARPICQPNTGFVKQLKEYEAKLEIKN